MEQSNLTLPQPLNELRSLIKERKLTKERFEDPAFQATIRDVEDLLYSEDQELFWHTVATLGRTASFHKSASALVQPILKRRLSQPPPKFVRLSDSMDRYYVATMLEIFDSEQFSPLAFQEIAAEETGEKAREVWIRLAIRNSGTLADFLSELNQQIKAAEIDGLTHSDIVCRRVRRIAHAIKETLATADVDAGESFGAELQRFLSGHVTRYGPDDKELRTNAALDLLNTLSFIIRLNFVARLDPASYETIDRLRRWWGDAAPPDQFQNIARRIVRLGLEALFMDARQGVMNKELRRSLSRAAGRKYFETLATERASKSHSLRTEIAYWFVHGTEPAQTSPNKSYQAMSESASDEYIARLLVTVDSAERKQKGLDAVLDQVRDIFPEEAKRLSDALKRSKNLCQWAEAVARSRRIAINPILHAIVEYDPGAHASEDPLTRGAKARVVSPGVVKDAPGGVKYILLKGEVEPIDG